MAPSDYEVAEIEARIRRLEAAIENFQYARRRLEKLYQAAEGATRLQLEQAFAVNQAAIEARKRDLAHETERLVKIRTGGRDNS